MAEPIIDTPIQGDKNNKTSSILFIVLAGIGVGIGVVVITKKKNNRKKTN